jgi:predicted RNA-binding protein YlqC (UPF0109 family)
MTMQKQGRESGEEEMVSLVRQMVMSLVDEPGSVEIQSDARNGLVMVHVTVARGDVGKLIGKMGRTARSMRTILAAAGMKSKVRCELNILEYAHGERTGAA